MTLFFAILLAVVAVLGAVDAVRRGEDPRRVLAAGLGLVLAASTRNLLWIVLGLEACSLAAKRFDVSALVASSVSLVGFLWIVAASRATDLAALDSTAGVQSGVFVFLVGLVLKWLDTRATPFVFVGASAALVAVCIRVTVWAPDVAGGLGAVTWAGAAALVVAGGVGAALSPGVRPLALSLATMTLGLAALGLGDGVTAVASVLAHVAASTVVIALAMSGPPPAGRWLAMLSLASVPPLPGFVSKLDLLASLPPSTLALACTGLVFAAIGCVRELERSDPLPPRKWVTLAAIATALAFGLFPESFLSFAELAAMHLS